MILPLSFALITLFASSVEAFKLSKGQCNQCQPDSQPISGGELPPPPQANQGPLWDLRAQRDQEYLQQEYYNQRPVYTSGSYYREPVRAPINYEKDEYSRAEASIKGGLSEKEKEINLYPQQQQPIARQPQYSPSAYGTQQLALVLIRPLQLSPQQHYPTDQYPSYANLFMQAPPQPQFNGRPELLPFPPQPQPLPLPDQQQQQQFGGSAYGPGGDKFGGVFAKSHEKLSKLKSHLERFAADAKAKLNLGSTYHYNGEETLPGPQPFSSLPPHRPQFLVTGRPQGPQLQQQQQQQGQLEMADIQLGKQEQEKIRENQQQEKLEQQQEQPALEQERTLIRQEPERLPLQIKQQQVASEETAAKAAPDANEGFGRRQSSKTL